MQKETIDMSVRMSLHIEAFKTSGMNIEEYCSLHQIKPATYYYWRKKLLGGAKGNTGSFIQLQALPSAGSIEVIFPHGVKIHFDSLVPAGYLKQLVG